MRHLVAALSLLGLIATPAWCETQEQLLNQGPPKTSQPLPDPGHIPMVFGKDIPWKGKDGEQQAALFGDPNKPGIYGVLIKWDPGHNSQPHFHSTDRYAYVVSGTWWTSTSKVYDERTTFPVHAGSVAVDKLKGIHWDGCRTGAKEPAVLVLAGTGPNITQYVDENGKDLPPPPKK